MYINNTDDTTHDTTNDNTNTTTNTNTNTNNNDNSTTINTTTNNTNNTWTISVNRCEIVMLLVVVVQLCISYALVMISCISSSC